MKRCLAEENPSLNIKRWIYDDDVLKQYQLESEIDLEHLAQLRSINLQWIAVNQKNCHQDETTEAVCYGWAIYEFIIEACDIYLGKDWAEYFYPEFRGGLTPRDSAFDYMVNVIKKALADPDPMVSQHPGLAAMDDQIYGFFVNMSGHHPNMKKLVTYLIFASTEELYLPGRKQDNISACGLLSDKEG